MTGIIDKQLRKIGITVSKPFLAAICIVFGIVVILVPSLLSILIGIFLIIQGALLITEHLEVQRQQQKPS